MTATPAFEGQVLCGEGRQEGYYCHNGQDQLVLGLVAIIGHGPTYLIWTAIAFLDRLGSNGKLQASDPSGERILSQRTVHTHMCCMVCRTVRATS